jgi:hypothetical protein
MKYEIEAMLRARGGTIVNVASISGLFECRVRAMSVWEESWRGRCRWMTSTL